MKRDRTSDPYPAGRKSLYVTPDLDDPLASLGFEPLLIHEYDPGPTPVVVTTSTVGFDLGAGIGTRGMVLVDGVWPAERSSYRTFRARVDFAFENRPYSHVVVPLVPNSVNRIRFALHSGRSEHLEYFLSTRIHGSFLPPAFEFIADKEVTDAELDAELRRMIELAGRVSRNLGEMLEGNVEFHDRENSVTGKIDPEGPNTLENTRIRLSRPQWRNGLLHVKCAADDDERARRMEEFLRQAVSQLLHEATHRRGYLDGEVDDQGTTDREERRTTEALIRRLIDLLERLRTRIPGEPGSDDPRPLEDGEGLTDEDATEWFDRLRAIVERQLRYRWDRGKPFQPNRKWRKVLRRWNEFVERLQEIRDDPGPTDDEKRERAEEAFEEFESETEEDRQAVENAMEMDWRLDWDRETLQPVDRLTPRGTFQGREIPDRIH